MSKKSAIRLAFEDQRSLAFGSIGATYTGVGTAFDNPVRVLYIQNVTDELVQFSLDGINDHFVLPANGFLLLDITANKTQDSGFYAAEGDRVYVKEVTTPTSGAVYVSVVYGEDQ